MVFDRMGCLTAAIAVRDNRTRLGIMIAGLLFALSILLTGAAQAASQYYTPQRGSAERQAIMDAARVPVSAAIGRTVIFRVSILRSDGDWAYLQAEPRNPDGSALDWSRTRFAEDWAMDAMSDVIMVLLRRSGSGFQVVDHIIGPTDVAWYGWLDRYGLPEALFSAP